MTAQAGKTLDLFEDDIGPCRHCGGQGRFIEYDDIPFLGRETERFLKITCTRCTYETNGQLLKPHTRKTLRRVWDNGTPTLVLRCTRKNNEPRYLTILEYHGIWYDRWTLPRLRSGEPLYAFDKAVKRWTSLDNHGKPVDDSLVEIENFRKLPVPPS